MPARALAARPDGWARPAPPRRNGGRRRRPTGAEPQTNAAGAVVEDAIAAPGASAPATVTVLPVPKGRRGQRGGAPRLSTQAVKAALEQQCGILSAAAASDAARQAAARVIAERKTRHENWRKRVNEANRLIDRTKAELQAGRAPKGKNGRPLTDDAVCMADEAARRMRREAWKTTAATPDAAGTSTPAEGAGS